MRDLAQRIDVSANLINLWERGDVDVPDYRVDNLSNYLGVDKEILFKEKHNTKDLMLIEIARANFKIKEYKSALDNESINEIIESGQRADAGFLVPASGLCLKEVFYK